MRRVPLYAGVALILVLGGSIAGKQQDAAKPARTPQQVAADIDRLIAAKLKEEIAAEFPHLVTRAREKAKKKSARKKPW